MVSDLEDVIIQLEGNRKIVEIRGIVKSVEGFDRKHHFPSPCRTLRISLNPNVFDDQSIYSSDSIDKFLLNFYGTSPVMAGDKIRAGLISKDEVRKNWSENPENIKDWVEEADALYIEIIGSDGHHTRRDFRNGYNPLPYDKEKLGLRD